MELRQLRYFVHVVAAGVRPTDAGLPFLQAMRARYPDVRLHLVENLSGHLASMLNARQLDLAVLLQTGTLRHCSVLPLLDERLFVAGEMMAGHVLGQGYTAGVGMSIGTACGTPCRARTSTPSFRTT